MNINSRELADLIRVELKFRTIENLTANASKPEAMKRRMNDILHGKTDTVTLRVADEILCTLGRPDWLALLT